MSYVIEITVPLAYEADNDLHAQLIAEHFRRFLASNVTYPHNAEAIDAPAVQVHHIYNPEDIAPDGDRSTTLIYDSAAGGVADVADADPGDCADCRDERDAVLAIVEAYS